MLTGATAFCPDPWLSPPHPAAVSGALSRTPRPWMGKFLAWHHQTRFPNPSGPQPAATFLGGVDPDSSIACPRPVVHGPGLTETVQGRCCLASDRQRARIPNHITFQLGLLFSPLCNAIKHHAWGCQHPSLCTPYSNVILFAASLRGSYWVSTVLSGARPELLHRNTAPSAPSPCRSAVCLPPALTDAWPQNPSGPGVSIAH